MDEEALIRAAGEGDTQAFETLVRTYQGRIYNLMFRMTGSRDDALDLTQETFLKAWNAISLFQFDSRFSTWLSRIAANTCLDFLRKEKRRPSMASLEADALAVPDGSVDGDPVKALEAKLDRAHLYEALQQLPKEYRMALTLRAMEDLSYEEIGEILEVQPGTVRSRIYRARERMRQQLSGNFSDAASSKKKRGGDGHESL
jgi:RNA polymerase sigma-70 factor (ECF subfamily)